MRLRSILRLGLGIRDLRGAWIATGLVLLGYLATMARDLTFYDSPELALVAHELGVGHPIGMPWHTLLGFVFAHLPFLSPHVGLTFMSALFGALAVLPAWSLTERLEPAPSSGETTSRSSKLARRVRVAAFLGVGLSLVAWEPSTRVEVYTLASFLALWATARVVDRPGAAAGFALGLAACTNAVIAVGQAVALLPTLLPQRRRESESEPDSESESDSDSESEGETRAHWLRSILALLAGGLLGLGPYLLLPLLASDPRRFAWGAPRDLPSLAAYLRGADYAHNQGIAFDAWLDHVAAMATWALSHGILPIAILGAGAFVALGRRSARIGYTVLIAGALDLAFVAANVVFHPDVPDYRGYLLTPLWLAGAGTAALAVLLVARGGRFVVYGAAIAALPLASLAASFQHLTEVRDHPSLARVLAEGALDEAPPDAIVIVEADHWIAPLLYTQEVEGRRPDVTVVARGLASSSWFWEHTRARHPDLADFELVGPGGRSGRLGRFVAANPERTVLVEHAPLARELGLTPCGVGFLVFTACREPIDPDLASSAIEGAGPFRGESLEVAARVNEARGEVLWRMGGGAVAARAFLAGFHRSGLGPALGGPLPSRAPPLGGALPSWGQGEAAIHSPLRTLTLSALLLHSMGRPALALELIEVAEAGGFDEAAIARGRIVGH